jgi:hypothetical protein
MAATTAKATASLRERPPPAHQSSPLCFAVTVMRQFTCLSICERPSFGTTLPRRCYWLKRAGFSPPGRV